MPTINFRSVREQALSQDPRPTPGVRVLQRTLSMVYGLDITPDGVYGPQTRAAVRRHEQSIGAEPANGIIDLNSLTRLATNFYVKVD